MRMARKIHRTVTCNTRSYVTDRVTRYVYVIYIHVTSIEPAVFSICIFPLYFCETLSDLQNFKLNRSTRILYLSKN